MLATIMLLSLLQVAEEVKLVDALLEAVPNSADAYLRKAGAGFKTTSSGRVQAHLFREDLIWQSRGFTKYQLDVCVFIAFSIALDIALKEAEDILSKSMSPEEQLKLSRIQNFIREAEEVVDKLEPKVEVKPRQLRIYF